jgi:hypothetical protein
MKFGRVIHKNRVYQPFLIDRRRLMMNAANLCPEVVQLLAESILTNFSGFDSDLVNVEYLNKVYAKISVNDDIG